MNKMKWMMLMACFIGWSRAEAAVNVVSPVPTSNQSSNAVASAKVQWPRDLWVLRYKINKAAERNDWAEVTARLDEAQRTLSEQQFNWLRVPVLLNQKNYAAAIETAKTVFSSSPRTVENLRAAAWTQNEIAWTIAADNAASPADLAQAEKVANWADEVCRHRQPAVMDTLARVLFRENRISEAIGLEENAVRLSQGTEKAVFERTLDAYRRGMLPNRARHTTSARPPWGWCAVLVGLIVLLIVRLKRNNSLPPVLSSSETLSPTC